MIKVCFLSFSRSDYTSLKPVIQHALKDKSLAVQVIAGGSHLLKRFGNSIERFEQDGIKVDRITDFMHETDDSDLEIAQAFARAAGQLVNYLDELNPDLVFVLGDRWEMLAAVNAASILKIPIVHHSGGDLTQGALDNQIRYALSAQSHLHLVALEEHRRRLIAVGEEDWRVVVTGEPALTEIKTAANNAAIGEELGRDFVLATFHPTSFDSVSFDDQLKVFLETLDQIPESIILTAPNPDPGSKSFLEKLQSYAEKNATRVKLFSNLGTAKYYAAMSRAKFMVGNSSSGIWEAPSFALPVLNLGERQADRYRAANVIDAPLEIKAIQKALSKVRDTKFRSGLTDLKNPYGNEESVSLILKALTTAPDRNRLLAKKFIDPLKSGVTSK